MPSTIIQMTNVWNEFMYTVLYAYIELLGFETLERHICSNNWTLFVYKTPMVIKLDIVTLHCLKGKAEYHFVSKRPWPWIYQLIRRSWTSIATTLEDISFILSVWSIQSQMIEGMMIRMLFIYLIRIATIHHNSAYWC